MKKNVLFWMMLLPMALGIVSCTDVTDNPAPVVVVDDKPFPYDADIDPSVRPGDNFYEYALGKWLHSSNPAPSLFKQISEQNKMLTDEMLTNCTAPVVAQLRSQADEMMMGDSRTFDLLAQRLQLLEQVTTGEQLFDAFGALQGWGYGTLFRLVPGVLVGRQTTNVFMAGSMTDEMKRAVRMKKQETLDSLVNVYCGYLAGFGFSQERIAQIAENARKIETLEMNAYIPGIEMLRHPMKAKRWAPEGEDNTERILGMMGVTNEDVTALRFVPSTQEVLQLLVLFSQADEDPEAIEAFRDYMIYNVIAQDAPFIPSIDQETTLPAMLKRALQNNRYYMYRLLTEYYGYDRIYKQQCNDILENMRQLFIQRLENLDWMSDATKAEARQKAEAMLFYVGYPEQWNDALTPTIDADFLLASVTQLRQNAREIILNMAGKPLEDIGWDLWASMAGFTTDNAFYLGTANSLVILPAEITKPRFDYDLSEATLYAFSTTFSHEFCHGFDASGSNYDAQGQKRDWWTPEDKQAFQAKQQIMVELYNQLEAYPGQPANGQKTLAENMADYGGVELALELYKQRLTQQGFQGAQFDEQIKKFFLSYAQVWKDEDQLDVENLQMLYELDTHSANHVRVNGMMRLQDEWYRLYDVKETDKLYLKPEDRVKIW